MTKMPMNKRCRHKSPRSGETGFTFIELIIVLVIASILGIFIFQTITKCLASQIKMQNRKERSDDAIYAMERMNRELREAWKIWYAGPNTLIFEKNITSNADPNTVIKYIRDIPSKRLMRQSAQTLMGLPGNSTSGDVIATDVQEFYSSNTALSKVYLQFKFTDGSNWQTHAFPRNYLLGP